jgi:tRNA dimethylallyltransferase
MPDSKLIAIVGPTASGKSALALDLAERFNGEIVNYDSVQIYRHLNIGTAKPSLDEQARVPHHMIDLREPSEVYNAGDYQRDARAVLEEIRERNRLPILVGGTGLYLRALIDGLFDGPPRSLYWRSKLEEMAERKGREYLHRVLKRLDSAAAERIGVRDKPKVIRAIEVRLETGKSLSTHFQEKGRDPLTGFDIRFIGLNPSREELYRRIDERVRRMFELGLVEEVVNLLNLGTPRSSKAFEAIGYRHVLSYLDGSSSRAETIRIMQRDTRRYSKRQMTWFRPQAGAVWFDGPGESEDIKGNVRQALALFDFF